MSSFVDGMFDSFNWSDRGKARFPCSTTLIARYRVTYLSMRFVISAKVVNQHPSWCAVFGPMLVDQPHCMFLFGKSQDECQLGQIVGSIAELGNGRDKWGR
eukprot:8897478-Pyramimonas_sp.AAC.1